MRKTRFLKPYNKEGKTRFPARQKSGVYLIKEDASLVYVGFSGTDLYKTMYRHFQEWNHPGQPVVSYAGKLKKKSYTVRVVYCTPKQAASLEKALIKKHKPRDCRNKYAQLAITSYDEQTIGVYGKCLLVPDPEPVPF